MLLLSVLGCKPDAGKSSVQVGDDATTLSEQSSEAEEPKGEAISDGEMKTFGATVIDYPRKENWRIFREFALNDLEISSIACFDHYLYVADESQQQVFRVDTIDEEIKLIASGFAIGNISHHQGRILMPMRNAGTISVWREGGVNSELNIEQELMGFQAFSGVSVTDYAVLDKVRCGVFRKSGDSSFWMSKKGSGPGDLSAPEDILFGESIYVTDKGNKRVQVFSLAGDHQRSFGAGYLKDPRGLTYDGKILFIADPELGSVQCYSREGNLLYALDLNFENPVDVYHYEGHLYVADDSAKKIYMLRNEKYSEYY